LQHDRTGSPVERASQRWQREATAQGRLENRTRHGKLQALMPLILLNRINKGGEIVINSDHILFIEIESRTTTLHLTGGMLFSVEETPHSIAEKIEAIETARLANASPRNG
jgi:hypothetical protein